MMLYRNLIGAVALAALSVIVTGAWAFDDSKYPDMKGQWNRIGPPNWQAVNGPAPLTPEYKAMYDANRADMAGGIMSNTPVATVSVGEFAQACERFTFLRMRICSAPAPPISLTFQR